MRKLSVQRPESGPQSRCELTTAKGVPYALKTARLTLRCPDPSDDEALYEAVQASRNELAEFIPWATESYSLEQAREYSQKARERFESDEDYSFRAFLNESGECVGGCGLHRIDWSVPRFEIGYWVATKHWRNGYATELSQALATLALGDLGAQRVEICCDADNLASAAIPPKIGFRLEATMYAYSRHHLKGTLCDRLVFVKLAPSLNREGLSR